MRLLASIALVWIWLHGYLFAQSGTTDSQCHSCITATALNGEFVGMDEIKNYEPGKKWFHENSLLIRDNEALLDKVPLKIVKGRKNYSASDSGFITYRGRFFDRDKDLFISLRPFDSDYIAFPIGGCQPYSKVTVFPVKMTSRGIEIDGVLYYATTFSRETRQHLSLMLPDEPIEYTGVRPYRPDLKRPPCQ
jgi:hypothetical protein